MRQINSRIKRTNKKEDKGRVYPALKRRRKIAARRMAVSVILVAALIILLILAGKSSVKTDAAESAEKYFKSITIEGGDTLYDISQEYGCTVEEIKEINDLDSNTIHAGQSLVVIYYK